MSAAAGKTRPRRKWWQYTLRAAAAAAAIAVAAYATLPWWLPTGWLARRIERQLSREIGAAVTVGALSVDWVGGLTLDQMRIANVESVGGGDWLTVDRVRMDFSPLRAMLAGRVEWMIVESPQAALTADEQGRWNIHGLRPPGADLVASRVSVRNALVTMTRPGRAPPIRLTVPDAQVLVGRSSPLGRVTLSARLGARGASAPIFLDFSVTSPPGRPARAMLVGSFDRLDLAAVGAADWLGLPVERLAGVCSASVRLPVREGRLVGGRIELSGENLQVRPLEGEPLGTLDYAGVALTANADLAWNLVELTRVEVDAGAIQLSGAATIHASMLAGHWLGFQSLRLRGKMDPKALSVLLPTGSPPWSLAGEVGVDVQMRRADDRIDTTLALDAADAAAIVAGRVVKPAGEALGLTVRASARPKTGALVIDRTELTLGGNRLAGTGALANLRRLIARRVGPGQRWIPIDPAKDLAGLDWSGTAEVTDLDVLRRLHPALERALADVTLTGRVAGRWTLDHAGPARLKAQWNCPSGSALTLGEWFHKAPERAATLKLAYYDESATMDLSLGEGRLALRLDDLRDLAADAGGLSGRMRGRFELDRAEHLLACLPFVAERVPRNVVGGVLAGDFTLNVRADRLQVQGVCDATQLAVDIPGVAAKGAGEFLKAGGRGAWDFSTGVFGGKLTSRLSYAEATGKYVGDANGWSLTARAAVHDAARLGERAVILRRIEGLDFGGAATAELTARGNGGAMTAELDLTADELDVSLADGGRRKRRGTPLRVILSAEDQAVNARVRLADSTARLSVGRLQGDKKAVSGDFQVKLDDALLDAAPELTDWVRRCEGRGELKGRFNAQVDAPCIRMDVDLDATALQCGYEPWGLTKPAGLPAQLSAAGTLDTAAPRLAVHQVGGRLGRLNALAEAVISPRADAGPLQSDGLPALRVDLCGRLWTDDATELTMLSGRLSGYLPGGDLEVQARASAELPEDLGALATVHLPYVTARMKYLRATHRGREVVAEGDLTLTDLTVTRDDQAQVKLRIGRIRSDALRLACEPSAATIVMDVRDPQTAPVGTIRVKADRVDTTDLGDWLAPQAAALPQLTEAYREQIASRAREYIDRAARFVQGADLTVAADIRRLLNWRDIKTGVLYDVNDVALRATVKAGKIDAKYTGGLCGGTLIDRFDTDLTVASPVWRQVSTSRDLMATDELQPQVAAEFPDNEVRGFLWREMDVSTPLVDVVAQSLDNRLLARLAGTGRTTLIEGVTRGRAAPKFVTAIFPGLDLVEYEYDKMVSFSEYMPDGTAYNDMVFTGAAYDLYVEGNTDPNQWGRYSIGLIVPGTRRDDQWRHKYKQGRVPLLEFRARLVGGKKLDEEVWFTWPNQAAFRIFLSNNYLYRLWLEGRPK